MKVNESHSVMSNSLQPHGLYSLWNSPGQNTGVGSVSLLQGTFPTQGSNPSLHVLQADSLPAEPQGTPKNTGVGFSYFSHPNHEKQKDYSPYLIGKDAGSEFKLGTFLVVQTSLAIQWLRLHDSNAGSVSLIPD